MKYYVFEICANPVYICIYIYWHKKYKYVVGSQGVYWKTQTISLSPWLHVTRYKYIHVENIYQGYERILPLTYFTFCVWPHQRIIWLPRYKYRRAKPVSTLTQVVQIQVSTAWHSCTYCWPKKVRKHVTY